MENSDNLNLKKEINILDHLEFINHLCLQIKNLKNKVLKDIYKNYFNEQSRKKYNLETFEKFHKSIIQKERSRYNFEN